MNTISFENILNTEYISVMRKWRNQDFVRRNMTNQDIISEEEHIKYIQMLKEESDVRKVYVALKNNVIPFAVVNFIINRQEHYIEPGMYIINKDFLGKGYGQIVSYARLEYIFKIMPDGEMRTTILASNNRNIALQTQFGAIEHHKTKVIDGNGIMREASVLYLNKAMWEEKKVQIRSKIVRKFNSIKICEIPY